MDGEEVVLDSPVEVGDEGVQPEVDVTDPPEPETETPEGEQPQDETKGDARALPRDVQKALKSLRENPETANVAKTLNDVYFRQQAYEKLGKVQELSALKMSYEAIGGDEGISELQTKAETLSKVDEDIAAGRPEFLDDIIESSPDGFKKLVPHVLQKLWKLDPAAYGNAVAPVIGNTLKNYQIPQIIASLKGSTDPASKVAAEHLEGLMADVDAEMRKSKATAEDPRAKELDTREQRIAQEEEKTYKGGIARTTIAHMNSVILRSLAPNLKLHPLTAEAKTDLATGINAEVSKMLQADAKYQRELKAMLAKREAPEKVTRYVNARIEEAARQATKAVWARRYGATNGVRKPAPTNGKAPAPQGFLSQKPEVSKLDKIRGWELLFMQGKGYIGGKAVSWKK
jgi:hypothetical protein